MPPYVLRRVAKGKMQYAVLATYIKQQYIFSMPRRRPKTKTTTMTLRVSPELKAAAEQAAYLDHRSLTGLIEVLILNHCKHQNIPVSDPMKETSP